MGVEERDAGLSGKYGGGDGSVSGFWDWDFEMRE